MDSVILSFGIVAAMEMQRGNEWSGMMVGAGGDTFSDRCAVRGNCFFSSRSPTTSRRLSRVASTPESPTTWLQLLALLCWFPDICPNKTTGPPNLFPVAFPHIWPVSDPASDFPNIYQICHVTFAYSATPGMWPLAWCHHQQAIFHSLTSPGHL